MKLDYTLTQNVFNCQTKEDIEALHKSGADFNACSRLALDEILGRIFKKKCHGTKALAIEMLVGCINGVEVADVNGEESGVPTIQSEDNSPAAQMDPDLRMQKIAERVDALVQAMPKYFEYSKKLTKDPELKMLGATDLDLKYVAMRSQVAICGQGVESKKYYLMKRNEENIKIAMAEGDNLFYLTETAQ